MDQSHNAEYYKNSGPNTGINNNYNNSNSGLIPHNSNSSSSSSSGYNNNNHYDVFYQKSFIDENEENDTDRIEIKDFRAYSSIYSHPNSNSIINTNTSMIATMNSKFNSNNNTNNRINQNHHMPLCYASIAASPSFNPSRKFCSVCGYIGTYTCTRCGCRYCCSKCLASHKETRCLKFAY